MSWHRLWHSRGSRSKDPRSKLLAAMREQERVDARRWEPPQGAPKGIAEVPRRVSEPTPSKEYYHLPGISMPKKFFHN